MIKGLLLTVLAVLVWLVCCSAPNNAPAQTATACMSNADRWAQFAAGAMNRDNGLVSSFAVRADEMLVEYCNRFGQ